MVDGIGPDLMAEELNAAPEQIQKWRDEVRLEQSAEERAAAVQNALCDLANLPNELEEEALRICEAYSACWDEFEAGLNAQVIEIHSDDAEQRALARRFRELCRESFLQNDYCLFVEQALPLAEQLTTGIALSSATEGCS